MILLSCDPGPEISAWAKLRDGVPFTWDMERNDRFIDYLRDNQFNDCDHLAIEIMQGYGMPIGNDVLITQLWAGRIIQAWYPSEYTGLTRTEVKGHLCRIGSGNDSTVRTALIERYGGESVAIGGRKCRVCKGKGKKKSETCHICRGEGIETPQGPLYGITGDDIWSACSIGKTWWDKYGAEHWKVKEEQAETSHAQP